MKITMKKDSKNKVSKVEAPIALTPEQITEIAAGTVTRGGGTTVSGRIPVNPVRF